MNHPWYFPPFLGFFSGACHIVTFSYVLTCLLLFASPIKVQYEPVSGALVKRGQSTLPAFGTLGTFGGVSRSWASADRWVAVVLTGSKRGVCHVSVITPIMTSSHRPALKAARRCIRPLTVVA